jgi:lipopolysaccharide transport system ATP-binding protein
MTTAVALEHVTKRYPRGGPRYASLRHEMASGVRQLASRIRGRRPAPRGRRALENISFDVEEGESFAIIGPNGSGKTTALKLVSRITYPTSGRIRVRGRVGALIEVGAGLHPELSGRENISLYGQILGMKKADIRRRFDEIVDFAEVSDALDTPVKMYSSGMQLRLGFAIASHLEPDVFVVDEALAVGDAGFQAKCVERMTKLVAEGRTLLFVSHELSTVEAVCERGLFLLDGQIAAEGTAHDVLRDYLDWVDRGSVSASDVHLTGHGLEMTGVTFHGQDGQERYAFDPGEPVEVRLHVEATSSVTKPQFSVGISDGRPGLLILCSMLEGGGAADLAPGHHTVGCRIDSLPLNPRTYEVWTSVRTVAGAGDLVDWSPVGTLRIRSNQSGKGPASLSLRSPSMGGAFRVNYSWTFD